MKILQRYVFREIWFPFLLCFFTLSFIFMGGYLVRAADFIIGRGVPLWDTLYVLLLAMPDMISYTVPTSILTAVLIVFGNFSQTNEIRAVKASGIHPVHMMVPALLIGVGLSFAMFLFNDQVTANASFQLRRTTKSMMLKNPRAMIEPGRFVKFNENIIFLTKEMNGNNMKDIVVYEIEHSDKPVRTIIAESGEIVPQSTDEVGIRIRLFNGSVSDAEEKGVQAIQFKTYEFSAMAQSDIRNMQKKVRDLSLAEIMIRLDQPGVSEDDRRELWGAFHNRIAFSLGCFIFVFLGIPVAMLVRRGEIVLSFGISMSMACIYYILFVGAKTISVEGSFPPVLAFWMPNLLLLGLGGYFLRKAITN